MLRYGWIFHFSSTRFIYTPLIMAFLLTAQALLADGSQQVPSQHRFLTNYRKKWFIFASFATDFTGFDGFTSDKIKNQKTLMQLVQTLVVFCGLWMFLNLPIKMWQLLELCWHYNIKGLLGDLHYAEKQNCKSSL